MSQTATPANTGDSAPLRRSRKPAWACRPSGAPSPFRSSIAERGPSPDVWGLQRRHQREPRTHAPHGWGAGSLTPAQPGWSATSGRLALELPQPGPPSRRGRAAHRRRLLLSPLPHPAPPSGTLRSTTRPRFASRSFERYVVAPRSPGGKGGSAGGRPWCLSHRGRSAFPLWVSTRSTTRGDAERTPTRRRAGASRVWDHAAAVVLRPLPCCSQTAASPPRRRSVTAARSLSDVPGRARARPILRRTERGRAAVARRRSRRPVAASSPPGATRTGISRRSSSRYTIAILVSISPTFT